MGPQEGSGAPRDVRHVTMGFPKVWVDMLAGHYVAFTSLVRILCWWLNDFVPRTMCLFCFVHRGKYRVRLFDITQNRWRVITVDDLIPTRHGQPIFAKPNGKELWVVLLEKAIAK